MKLLLRLTLLSLFCLIVGCGAKTETSSPPVDAKEKQKMEDMMKKSSKTK